MKTKKTIYLVAFTTLGLLIGFLVHAFVEIGYIKLLEKDFIAYSFGLSWNDLMFVHDFVIVLLLAACGIWGYKSGKYWWHQIYVLKKIKWRPWF